VVGVVIALFAIAAVGARYGLVSDTGRELVSGFVNGKKLGRYGRIDVYGLRGDVWSDFTLERVTVTDADGVWLEARDVRVDWNARPLVFGRTFKADLISADVVRVIRRPKLEPDLDEPPGELPLSIHIERLQTRLELLEGFSEEYGRWAVGAAAHVNRVGSKSGAIVLKSLSQPGDFARANVQIGGGERFELVAQAVERKGGTLAGALGFSPDQPFTLDVDARGRTTKGRLRAILRSGEVVPLNAEGGWDASGGTIRGRALLSTSDLTRPYVRRIGLEPRFGLAARRAERGRYAVAWFFGADNLESRASGFIDPETRASEDGFRIALSVGSLSRLLDRPVAGATRYEAVWRGDTERWTLDGRLDARSADLGGYELGRLSGPVDVTYRDGRFDIDADLAGAGGGGSGVVAGLLGRAPTATLNLARLPDGRLLLERLEAEGAALRVRGSGGRGLGGGLSFRGQATVTDLSRVRPDARGSLGGTIRASQTGAAGWRLAFEARGRRFASGLGQLDRLLGAAPSLRGEGSLDDGLVRINSATLNGRSGSASARGQIRPGGRLALSLNWNARGPFAAGPVEIAGSARGSGSLTGTLAAPAASLRAGFEAIDLPQLPLRDADVTLRFAKDRRGYDGALAIQAQSPYGPARARSDFRFAPDGVRLSGLDLDAGGVRAQGALALRNNAPSSADLTFAAGPGAFLTAGSAQGAVRLTEGSGATPAMIDVTGRNLQLRGSTARIRSIRLQGSGTLSRLPFTVSTEVTAPQLIAFDGNGVYSRSGQEQTLALNGRGRVRRAAFSTNRPILVRLAGDTRSIDLDLAAVGGRLTAVATQGRNTVEARATLDGVSLGAFGDYEGLVDATATLNGRGRRLDGGFQAQLTDARTLDSPRELAVDADVRGVLSDDRLQISTDASAESGLRASAAAILPVQASASPLRLAVVRTGPIEGRYEVAGQVRPVWDLLMGGGRTLAGVIDSRGTLGGTLNAPSANGYLNLRQGRFEDSGTGLVLAGVSADARFDRNAVVLQTFQATDEARGVVTGEGRASLLRGGASNLTLALNRFQVLDSDIGRARASGPLTVVRDAQGRIRIEGDLTVVEAEIAPEPPTPSGVVGMDVVEINRPDWLVERQEERQARGDGPPIALDVRIRAPNQVFVRGRGLDVELALDATVRGTVADPDLDGRARVVRGDFSFAGKRFEFDERGTILLDEEPRNIRLDLRAVNETPTLTAAVEVTGTAAAPVIELVSTPDLPDDEILSQVLFGRSASQLSPLEAAQLAAGVAALSGGGGFDVFGNLREFAGLDRLAFGADASGAMTVAGGRYISDDVFLELIGGGVEGPAVQVEWRPRRNLSVLSRLAGQGGARLSVRWRREYR
jgi:translocation and assembly module TamB